MTSHALIFRPVRSSSIGIGEELELNRDTPRGLFLANSGNKYVVCEDSMARYAIALQHSARKPFSYVPLNRTGIEPGKPLGVGIIRCLANCELTYADHPLGVIEIMDHAARMMTQNDLGQTAFIDVAWATEHQDYQLIAKWQMKVGKTVFFEFDASCQR